MVFEFFLHVALGLALGALGGLFGIGGGLIAIPVLAVGFALPQQLAQGTALVMVVPNVMLALWRYHQRNRIDWRNALALALPGLGSAFVGSSWALALEARQMRLAFAGFLLVLAIYTLARAVLRSAPASGALRYPWPWLTLVGGGAGVAGGLFAVGGAVLATPLLTTLFGASQVVAQGLALAMAAPSTAAALATYALHGEVLWQVGLPLALGGLLSISLGVRLAHALPERLLRGLFSLFLVASAALLLRS